MLEKMSEAQRSMLQDAATREDRFVTPPIGARAKAITSLAGKLIEGGWVKEVKARNGAPVWRKDPASGETFALKLTVKGLKAATATIAASHAEGAPAAAPSVTKTEATANRAVAFAEQTSPAPDASADSPSAIQARAPRATSKIGRVLEMLAADAGATIEELTAATGWLEHTTRAALTGLRHRGYELSLTRKERDGASVYRIVSPGGEAAR